MNINLKSLFIEKPTKQRFLVISCVGDGATFKSVSSVLLAKAIDTTLDKLQGVVRQRNGTILVEATMDNQIEKILKTKEIAGLR